jgi:hypothetical protein
MKRILFACIAVLAVSAAAFAQDGRGPKSIGNTPAARLERLFGAQAEALTIIGKLEWVNGRIAVKTGGKTYYVSDLRQLIGFADGLKEGAQVTLTGKAFADPRTPEYAYFRTEKLTFKGKDYALPEFGGGARGSGWARDGWRHGGGRRRSR